MRVKYDPSTAIDGRMLSPWLYHQPYLRGSSGGPLPVELVEFEALYQEATGSVRLDWVTASELNNDRFVVERSYDARNFKPLATVQGAGTTSEVRSYAVYDTDPGVGSIYYRIRQIDFDGTSSTSPVRVVRIEHPLIEVSLYPNPASEFVQVDGELPAGSTMQVFHLNGQLVRTETVQTVPMRMDVSEWTPGAYIVVVQSNLETRTQRLVVSR